MPVQVATAGVRWSLPSSHRGLRPSTWLAFMPTLPPIAVARVVVGTLPDPATETTGPRPVVLTLYRQPDGDGGYSIVMHRGGTGARR